MESKQIIAELEVIKKHSKCAKTRLKIDALIVEVLKEYEIPWPA